MEIFFLEVGLDMCLGYLKAGRILGPAARNESQGSDGEAHRKSC